MGLGIIAVPFLQARHRGIIEGNHRPAKLGSVYPKFPAGSTPRWRAHFFFDVSSSRRPQALSASCSQFRVGELKVLQNVFERLLHLHNKPELAIILY
jgi:hypothetical protein